LGSVGFGNFTAQVSVRYLDRKPETYIGSVENWEKAEKRNQLREKKKRPQILFKKFGEGCFLTRSQLDFWLKEPWGRKLATWSIQVWTTILPERFDLTYKRQ